MTPDSTSTSAGASPAAKPFPWYCLKCRKKDVYEATVSLRREILHDGRLHTVDLPELRVPQCRSCQELVFDNRTDQQIRQALRVKLHLLTPEQIRMGREAVGLSHLELADRLGIAEETLSRWETGALVQPQALDNLLRVYFAFPQVRSALVGHEHNQNPSLGTVLTVT